MGAIRYATSNSTDEEYGGAIEQASVDLTNSDFTWDSTYSEYVSNDSISDIFGTYSKILSYALMFTNGNAIGSIRLSTQNNKLYVVGLNTNTGTSITGAFNFSLTIIYK